MTVVAPNSPYTAPGPSEVVATTKYRLPDGREVIRETLGDGSLREVQS